MRKVVAGFAVSFDGYMEGANGEYDWMTANMDPDFDFSESLKRFDTFLIGRKTYEMMKGFNDPSAKKFEQYVFSKTLHAVDDGYILIRDDIPAFIKTLKEKPGKDIALYGGANLLATFINMDLVDEVSMTIVPILLGQGKPMVDVLQQRTWLTLTDIKRYPNGNVQLSYDVIKKDTAA